MNSESERGQPHNRQNTFEKASGRKMARHSGPNFT